MASLIFAVCLLCIIFIFWLIAKSEKIKDTYILEMYCKECDDYTDHEILDEGFNSRYNCLKCDHESEEIFKE